MAMVRLGFRVDEVMGMTEAGVEGYIEAYDEVISGNTRKYVVKRPSEKGIPRGPRRPR